VRALGLVDSWPVGRAAAAVVDADGQRLGATGDTDEVFELASISKVMFGWSVLTAVEEAVVALDDPVGQPGCTLRHLLAHAGGYPFDGPEPISRPERRRIYSNSSIELAAGHLEARAGVDVATYLAEAVFVPLGMTSTSLRGSPAHGVRSTVDDLARLLAELQAPRTISDAIAAEAVRTHFPGLAGIVPGVGRFDPCPWGLGAEVRGEKSPHWTGRSNSPATFGHFGGAGTMLWVDPVAGCGLVALTDRPFDDWGEEALRCWRELSDAVVNEVTGPRA
jgi:CubicO group peptidase (beta-lactamase class C family)